jgi:chemotaxis signal transduction protein
MSELSAFERDEGDELEKREDRTDCELLVIEQGELLIGVPARAVDSVVPWSQPAALPRTSRWVLGVVQDRGRLVAVRRAERGSTNAQRIVLCVTQRGLVGIPATSTRSVGTVRIHGTLRYGQPLDTDQGALTVLDPEALAEQMTQE